MKKMSPLQTKKFYKVKSPKREFLCALCSAPRAMKFGKYLSPVNYVQIFLLSSVCIWFLLPLMGAKSVVMILPVWVSFEFTHKLLYRRELTCPYCGFDPTWYRRDVNLAKSKVQDFWQKNYPELMKKEQVDLAIPPEQVMKQSDSTDSLNL